METKTQIPSFTISLRGYDREEVDEYLDSLADTLGHVDDTHEQNRRLQAHITRLNARIKDLEDRINADTPRTGAVLGERIGLLLSSAEDTATDTLNRAEGRAAEMVAEAEDKVAEAEEAARAAIARGEEQARRIEAAARGEAAEIISEAEARASARTRQIEQWAEEVVSHTRAEEARMLREHLEKRKAATAELRGLADHRDAAVSTLTELRESLGKALGLVGTAEFTPDLDQAEEGEAELDPVDTGVAEQADEEVEEDERPAEQAETAIYDRETDEASDGDRTGEVEIVRVQSADAEPETSAQLDQDDFDRKLEAWVSDSSADERPNGARHFRQH